MLFLTSSNLWSLVFFLTALYLILIYSLILYLIPIFINYFKYAEGSFKSYFIYINPINLFKLPLTMLFLFFLINLVWSSTEISLWFGHLIFSSFSYKIFYLLTFTIFLYLLQFFSNNYFSSKEIYDFLISIFNFYFWILFLFYANSIFTVIFIIEVISALIFLLIISSTFSTSFFYSNLNFTHFNYFQQIMPYNFINSILYFFWVSLISSLNLFLFLILLQLKIITFDWFILEYVFIYFSNTLTYLELVVLGLIWFILLFSIFLKCGIAPFFIWKPIFFKGLPFSTLLFYISFIYIFIFLFLIKLISLSFTELFFFYSYVLYLLIFLGIIILLCIMCETFYIKAFLAISSILNSLLVLLALNASNITNFYFFI